MTSELSTMPGDTAELIRLAAALTDPTPLGTNPQAFVVPDGYQVHIVDPEKYQPAPARKRGDVRFTDALSFRSYVAEHQGLGTTLWADAPRGMLTAVINDHQPEDTQAGGFGVAGWGDHRATLQLEMTDDWTLWAGQNNKPMNQAAFAEHIEDGAVIIREPTAADMLEIVQSFKATTKVRFESGPRIRSGETQLTYVEDTTATAGRRGQLEVPEVIVLGIAPWTSCTQVYELRARLRYRINNGDLVLFYKLDRPDDVLRHAFADLLGGIENELDITAYHGTPRQTR